MLNNCFGIIISYIRIYHYQMHFVFIIFMTIGTHEIFLKIFYLNIVKIFRAVEIKVIYNFINPSITSHRTE